MFGGVGWVDLAEPSLNLDQKTVGEFNMKVTVRDLII